MSARIRTSQFGRLSPLWQLADGTSYSKDYRARALPAPMKYTLFTKVPINSSQPYLSKVYHSSYIGYGAPTERSLASRIIMRHVHDLQLLSSYYDL